MTRDDNFPTFVEEHEFEDGLKKIMYAVVPRLDSAYQRASYEGEDVEVEHTQKLLASYLAQMGPQYLKQLFILLFGTAVVSWWFSFPALIYGLVVSTYGSIILATSSGQGRFGIAAATTVEDGRLKSLRASMVQQTVASTAGTLILMLGFIFQIIAVVVA